MNDRPPRVAFLLPGLGCVERGAERAFLEVAARLQSRHGMEVELFGRGGHFPDGLVGHRIPAIARSRFESFPHLPALRNECAYEEATFVAALVASRKFRPSRFDAAVTCSYPYLNWMLSGIPAKSRPLRLFVTQNGDWMCRRTNAEYRAFACDALVAINREYHNRHAGTWPTALIPNGVDPSRFAFTPRGEPSPQDRPRRVLMVSALIESKRVESGLRAVATLPGVELTIVGDGPLRGHLMRTAERLMPGRVTFKTDVPNERMPAEYAAADCFLHCSQTEPFGIVYLEAAASGCPVVTQNAPTQRWILGDAAVLTDTSDRDALADAVRSVLRPGTAARLSVAARERVERDWSWDTLSDRYADFLVEQLARRAASQSAPQEPALV